MDKCAFEPGLAPRLRGKSVVSENRCGRLVGCSRSDAIVSINHQRGETRGPPVLLVAYFRESMTAIVYADVQNIRRGDFALL